MVRSVGDLTLRIDVNVHILFQIRRRLGGTNESHGNGNVKGGLAASQSLLVASENHDIPVLSALRIAKSRRKGINRVL